jgi:3-methylcrotonyl-CoA carboxylase alpha subunit
MITTLLIANRGEIAVRIIRACRALGIRAVAVYSDADATALHVRMADAAYRIGPAPASESYLRGDVLIETAVRCGAQAIHPGYGFLSERASFARAVRDAGLVFIGPPPEAIERLGDKISARRLAESVGVPTAPGYAGSDQSMETLRREAQRIGFPLLIKASAGGGGRGMRVVQTPHEFETLLQSAQREALAAFGDGAVFLEKLLHDAHHIEVQILADTHGNVVHLFERDCSIQRRHQKILEESPAPLLHPDLRAELGAAAVRLARAAGYVNAGTVEFLVDGAGNAAFLEVNTRLQVEHPVTELITGLDLVQLQIVIAGGARLPFRQDELQQHGHAVEVRICAEDPQSFLPAGGRINRFELPDGVRIDSGFERGDTVSTHYDSLLAKLIVHADTRAEAFAHIRRALQGCRIDGIITNLPLLRALARNADVLGGTAGTDFLQAHTLDLTEPQAEPPPEVLAAAAIGELLRSPRHTDPWKGAWRHLRAGIPLQYRTGGKTLLVMATEQQTGWRIRCGAVEQAARVVGFGDTTLILAFPAGTGGEWIERFEIAEHHTHVQSDQTTRLIHWRGTAYRLEAVEPPEAGSIGSTGRRAGHAGMIAPMPGVLTKVLVSIGQTVVAHQPLVVLEAMKMEHTISAPSAGVVRQLPYTPGARVAGGALLVELDES